jgi:hypothetical protein
MDDTARLTVERTGVDDVRTRQVVVSLDGERIGTLIFGERTSRAIASGHHRLRAHNTLVWKTVEFDAARNEHVRFRVVNRAGLGSMTLVALLGVGPLFVTVERLPSE